MLTEAMCCKLLSRLGLGLEHNFNDDADVGGLDYVLSNCQIVQSVNKYVTTKW